VWLVIHHLDIAGGTEEPFTTLALGLRARGHRVRVFCHRRPGSDNQYGRRLSRGGLPIQAWPAGWTAFAGDWAVQDRCVRRVVALSGPLLWPPALALAVFLRLPLDAARRKVLGRWQAWVARLVLRDRGDALLCAALDAWRLVERPDLVHVFRSEMAPVVAWAARRGIPVVYSELCTPGGGGDAALWRERGPALRRASATVAVSASTRRGLRDAAAIRGPITVIPPVLSPAPAAALPGRPAGAALTVTCIARLTAEKGVDELLRAVPIVLGSFEPLRFEIAGDGPLRAALEAQCAALGIADRVRFTGAFAREDLPRVMERADVIVLPSLTEGMPFVIVEAMAYGRPVVATAVGGVPEVVREGETGLLVPPRDPERLAGALVHLLAEPRRRAAMGAAARQHFLAGPYTEASFVEAHLAVYQSVLAPAGLRSVARHA